MYPKKFMVGYLNFNKDKRWEGKRNGSLITPSKADFKDGKFDIQAFLENYVKYYNGDLREHKLTSIVHNAKVLEVK